jgi:hypothetical protein
MARKVTSALFPEEWQAVLDKLTGSSSSFRLGIRAARYTEKIRLRTGAGPTFAELFTYLWPEHGGVPSPFPDGLPSTQLGEIHEQFRHRVFTYLARSGWLRSTAKTRSLRPGPRYHVPIVQADDAPEPGQRVGGISGGEAK